MSESSGNSESLGVNPESLKAFSPVDVVFAAGMGPVKPQLRGKEGERYPIADFERMRSISVAVKELAANDYISSDGYIIPTGRATVNQGDLEKAYETRTDSEEEIRRAFAERVTPDGGNGTLTPEAFFAKYPWMRNMQDRNRFTGRPATPKEVEQVKETTESGLMKDLIEKTVAKPGASERKVLTQEVLEETRATNTIENIVRSLNLLDQKTGGVWEGTVGVVTSNFGHIRRIEELFLVFGIDKSQVVGISPEQVLRHFGYNSTYLDRYESLNADEVTLQTQERWIRGVREIPEYVIQTAALFENDQRLFQVLESFKRWYGIEKLQALAPELAQDFTTIPTEEAHLRADEMRTILRGIERRLAPEEWGKQADLSAWRQEIADYNQQTETWLSSKH